LNSLYPCKEVTTGKCRTSQPYRAIHRATMERQSLCPYCYPSQVWKTVEGFNCSHGHQSAAETEQNWQRNDLKPPKYLKKNHSNIRYVPEDKNTMIDTY